MRRRTLAQLVGGQWIAMPASMPLEGHQRVAVDAVASASSSRPPSSGRSMMKVAPTTMPPVRADELGRRLGRAAGGDQVVDDQDALARPDGVLVDLDDVDAVFQRVLLADGLPRQLALLADRDEAAAQPVGDGAAEDEAARLDAGHRVDLPSA